MPFYPLFGEGCPTKVDYRKEVGTLILTSPLEDLDVTCIPTVSSIPTFAWRGNPSTSAPTPVDGLPLFCGSPQGGVFCLRMSLVGWPQRKTRLVAFASLPLSAFGPILKSGLELPAALSPDEYLTLLRGVLGPRSPGALRQALSSVPSQPLPSSSDDGDVPSLAFWR